MGRPPRIPPRIPADLKERTHTGAFLLLFFGCVSLGKGLLHFYVFSPGWLQLQEPMILPLSR